MKTLVVENILVEIDGEVTNDELQSIVMEEKGMWQKKGKQVFKISITATDEELIIKAIEKSPIHRVRRITGYLSELPNFNNAKLAECQSRLCHL